MRSGKNMKPQGGVCISENKNDEMKCGKKSKCPVTAKLIHGSQEISAKKITYNTHSKQDGIVQLYFIRNLERSS
jgi:hypothetical protein